jgi:hypothetical protein
MNLRHTPFVRFFVAVLMLFAVVQEAYAQQPEKKDRKNDKEEEVIEPYRREIVQFSGIIKDLDNGQPIPFATIYVDKVFRGTISNMDGFFSFAVAKGDSIVIRSVGYKEARLQIPFELSGNSYHVMYGLEGDTIMLDEIVIYPWNKLHFKQHFINLEIPDDLQELAEETFAKANLADFSEWTDYDGTENFDLFINNYVGEIYYQGQSAPIQLMNPFAWAQFIKAIKAGKFKREKKDVIKY